MQGGSRRRPVTAGDLLEQLEHGEADGDQEGEEAELQSVPGLESQHTDGQRDQSHCLKKDEDQDGHEDLLQLVLAACNSKINTILCLVYNLKKSKQCNEDSSCCPKSLVNTFGCSWTSICYIQLQTSTNIN